MLIPNMLENDPFVYSMKSPLCCADRFFTYATGLPSPYPWSWWKKCPRVQVHLRGKARQLRSASRKLSVKQSNEDLDQRDDNSPEASPIGTVLASKSIQLVEACAAFFAGFFAPCLEHIPTWVFPKIGVGPQNGWFIMVYNGKTY